MITEEKIIELFEKCREMNEKGMDAKIITNGEYLVFIVDGIPVIREGEKNIKMDKFIYKIFMDLQIEIIREECMKKNITPSEWIETEAKKFSDRFKQTWGII